MTTSEATIQGFDPRTGSAVGAAVTETLVADLDELLQNSAAASQEWADRSRRERAAAL